MNMELYFLDEDFNVTDITDEFTSVVFSEKYYEIGTFCVHFPPSLISRVRAAQYIRTSPADEDEGDVKCGRIERIRYSDGGDCTAEGRLLEVLLADRIMVGNGGYAGTVTDVVCEAVSDNLRGSCVSIGSEQAEITETAELSYSYDNLAERLYTFLKPYGASFRVKLNETLTHPVFSVVIGCDRTTDTGGDSAVVFSPTFGNIASLEFLGDTSEQKNKAFVRGHDGTLVTVDKSDGGDKREIYVNADNISPTDYSSSSGYTAALRARGEEELSKHRDGMRLSAECDNGALPIYGTDYALGDVCDVCIDESGTSFPLMLTGADTVWENGTKTVFPSFGDEVVSIKKLFGGL